MAARSLPRTKPKDYRPAVLTLARMYAKEEAKRRIRAQGYKLSAYWPKDITVMSMAILEEEPEPSLPKPERPSPVGLPLIKSQNIR